MKSWVVAGLAAVCLSALAVSAQAVQFVVNGGFLGPAGPIGPGFGGQVTGWSDGGGYNFVYTPGTIDQSSGAPNGVWMWSSANGGTGTLGAIPGGGNILAADGDYITEPVTQNITGLKVGGSYTLTFNWATSQQSGFYGDTLQNWTACLGAQCNATATLTNPSQSISAWMAQTFTYTATSTSEVLSFLAHGNLPVPPFPLLTNVSLTGPAGATPVPAALPLFATGLGFLGAVARRRRKAAAAV
jgi:hypothetical protein